jgi:parvulin-like peptidyl-prolyl isomerase
MRNWSSILPAAGLLLAACSSLTSPPEAEVDPKPASLAKPAAAEVHPAATVVPSQPPPAPPKEPEIRASHILVAYKGARGAAPEVARTKEQAKKRAETVLKKAEGAGADFGALAKQYSDDPGSGPHGGELGTFTRAQMVKPFADAAFSLRPGQVSDIVETEFGFHIIKRTP